MASKPPSRFVLVGITWNKYGWKAIDVESTTSYDYTKGRPGHESLNFKFDKKNLDDNTYVYGYSPGMRYCPRRFLQPGIVFFYSKNCDAGSDHIVGVYGNARRLDVDRKTSVDEFKHEKLVSTIVAERDYSALFPNYLNAQTYKDESMNRLMPQGSLRYIDKKIAERIITDAVEGATGEDARKLRRIADLIYDEQADSEAKQERITDKIGKRNPLSKMHWDPIHPDVAQYTVEVRRRDTENIAYLKKYYDFKCQICQKSIVRKHGPPYVEAAHIKPKSETGSEIPSNILILCPNCHKEFDYGDRCITKHTSNIVEFTINGVNHSIRLASQEDLRQRRV